MNQKISHISSASIFCLRGNSHDIIRWNDTLETTEVRIALAMDSDTEKDDEIFYYCNGVDDLKSLADKSMEDFTIAECLGFGIYEELLQTT